MRPGHAFALVMLVSIIACGPSKRDEGACIDGMQQCDGKVFQVCMNSSWSDVQTCPMECAPTLGCTLCVPNTGTCTGDMSHACRADGQGFDDVFCDPVQGESCGSSG